MVTTLYSAIKMGFFDKIDVSGINIIKNMSQIKTSGTSGVSVTLPVTQLTVSKY